LRAASAPVRGWQPCGQAPQAERAAPSASLYLPASDWGDRPARKALLEDAEASKVDVVVAYKVDRLTRSLADFAEIVEIFDARGVSFVSVSCRIPAARARCASAARRDSTPSHETKARSVAPQPPRRQCRTASPMEG
jgi:hypothetical protein